MPTVAIVDGIRVIFYWNDHAPPHFHVEFAEHRAQISIETAQIMDGSLPAGKLAVLLAWARVHRKELQECWDKARNNEHPGKVE